MRLSRFPAIGLIMVLLPAAPAKDNPWTERVPAAVERAERARTAPEYAAALDVTWRADAWQEGVRLAEQALAKFPQDVAIRGRTARVFWRAGQILRAEEVVSALPRDHRDRVALRTQIALHLARRQLGAAERLADTLAGLEPLEAEDLYTLFSVRFERGGLAGAAELLRKAERTTDPANGYPQIFMGEAFDGVAEFLDAVGTEPLNQVARTGSAPMAPLVLLNLPAVEVHINGHGPFRMILDTGASIMVALDQTVADQLGLKSVAPAMVHGVSGKQETGQVLLDKLDIGTISCRRVLSRTFDVRGAILNAADGIIGSGIFTEARFTLDFAAAELRVDRSSATPGPGQELPLRIVGDAKLVAPLTIEGQPAAGFFDTGADALALSPKLLRQLFPDEELRTVPINAALGIGSDATPSIGFGRSAGVEIGGRTFESGVSLQEIDTLLGPIIGVQCDALIGMPAFRQMKTFTADQGTARMWIEWLPD